MASTTPYMNLVKWDQANDTFNYVELAENFAKIDIHDHSNGYGKQITSAGIAPGAIKADQLDNNSINQAKLARASVGKDQIQTNPPAIDRDRIQNGSITTEKLANSSAPNFLDGVTTSKIANSAITNSKLLTAVNAIGTTRPLYVDGTASATNNTLLKALQAVYPGYTPVNGDEVYYKAGTTVGDPYNGYVIWHLRYNQSSTYWEYIGGSSLFSESTDSTENDNTGTDYKISELSKIVLPYSLTAGIFDITFTADVAMRNTNNWAPRSSSISDLRDDILVNLRESEVGAVISYQWERSNGAVPHIDAAGGNAYAIADDLFAYGKINGSDGGGSGPWARIPQMTLTKTVRVSKVSTDLSRSAIKFAQRRADHGTPTGKVDFNNRTLQVRPIAIK